MWSEVVVDVAPVEVEDLGFEDGVEDLAIEEELIAEPGVEALDEGILPRVAGLDVERAAAREPTSIPNRVGDQLRPVVHRMHSGAPRLAFAWSSTSTTSSAVMERPS